MIWSQALLMALPVALVAVVTLQAVSFDLMVFLERFGLPVTMLVIGCYAIFVKRWVVPSWVVEEQREQYQSELTRERERADRMEKGLLEALASGRSVARVTETVADRLGR